MATTTCKSENCKDPNDIDDCTIWICFRMFPFVTVVTTAFAWNTYLGICTSRNLNILKAENGNNSISLFCYHYYQGPICMDSKLRHWIFWLHARFGIKAPSAFRCVDVLWFKFSYSSGSSVLSRLVNKAMASLKTRLREGFVWNNTFAHRFSQYSRGRGYRDWRTRGDPTLINSLWRSRQPLGIRKQLGENNTSCSFFTPWLLLLRSILV